MLAVPLLVAFVIVGLLLITVFCFAQTSMPDSSPLHPEEAVRDWVTLRHAHHMNSSRAHLRVIWPYHCDSNATNTSVSTTRAIHAPPSVTPPSSDRVFADTFVPCRYSQGVPMVQLTVNGARVKAVVDTGSSNLVVGTHACKSCAHEALGAMHGPTHDDTVLQADAVLSYGSQSIRANVMEATLFMSGSPMEVRDIEQLVDDTSRVRPNTDAVAVRMPTEVFATYDIQGHSSVYILGLAMSPPREPRPSVVHSILHSAPNVDKQFTLVLGHHNCGMLFGRLPQTVRTKFATVPLHRPGNLTATSTLFYMARLVDVWIGTSPHDMKPLAPMRNPLRPMWLLTDSGSTNTYLGEDLGREFLRHQSTATTAMTLGLVLEGGVLLMITPSAYQQHGESTLDCSGTLLRSILHTDGVLLGAVASRGLAIQHDLHSDTLGFAALGTGHK